jgi:tetratricopeptide (TPR) repeat protein
MIDNKLKIRKIRLFLLGLVILLPSALLAQKPVSLNETRQLVLNNRIGDALLGYSQLVAKDSTNTNLWTEYSYTLALEGAFDCALMNLDRVRLTSPNSSDGLFYTSLVFSLMGYDQLSNEFLKNVSSSKIPHWIPTNTYLELLKQHGQAPHLNKDDYTTALKRANFLAASALYLQSIALYEEIIRDYPSEYLPHVGYSIVLEKLNFYQQAADEMTIAVKMMTDNPKLLEAKTVFEKRVVDLNAKINSPQNFKNKLVKLKNEFNPQTMLYAGGMISSDYVSVNSRFGLYLNNSFNGAIDLSVGGNSDNISTNLGLSAYKRFGIWVWGEGLNLQMADHSVFSLKTSAGLSFINRNRNSSFDIFLDVYLPLSGGKTSYGISVGKSIYFGNR